MVRAHNHQVAEAERPGEIVVRWTARQVPALLVLAVTGAISLYAGSALAQDPEVEEKTEAGFPDEFTIEFDESHDWIRLTSGEWLGGDLNWMRDKDFESDWICNFTIRPLRELDRGRSSERKKL